MSPLVNQQVNRLTVASQINKCQIHKDLLINAVIENSIHLVRQASVHKCDRTPLP